MAKVRPDLECLDRLVNLLPVNATITSSSNSSAAVKISVLDRKSNESIATHECRSGSACTFPISNPSLWTPDSPNLYDIDVQLGDDNIKSYTGFRTISRGLVNGVERPLLNGDFIFLFGTLDQGFWPDGVYTPPTYEAMVFDIKTLKSLGFNMLRKHVSPAVDLSCLRDHALTH